MKVYKQQKNIIISFIKFIFTAILALIIVNFAMSNIFLKSSSYTVTSAMMLDKILAISDLSTVDTTYTSMVRVADPLNDNDTLYYVSYEAIISAGIDFNDITLDLDHQTNTVSIYLPESKVIGTNIDIASLDYLFIKDDTNNDKNILSQSFLLCKNDVENGSLKIDTINEIAYDNAVSVIKALTLPFMQTLGSNYSLEFVSTTSSNYTSEVSI